jgi:hypothetical protein
VLHATGDADVVVDVAGLTPLVNCILQRGLQLRTRESYLVDFLTNEVAKDGDCFLVLAVDGELAAACVLVESNEGRAVGLRHDVVIFFYDVDASGLDGVRVPQVDDIDDELGSQVVEEVVAVVMLVDVALDIRGLLEEQVGVRRCRLRPVLLGLGDEGASGHHLGHLDGLTVMHPYVALGLPLRFILVESVEVPCCVVEEHRLGRQAVQHLRGLIVFDGLQETTLFLAINDVQVLFSDSAKMDEELHAHAAGEERFIRRLAHFEKQLDPVVFAFPGQHVGVAFDDHDVNQVKSLFKEPR